MSGIIAPAADDALAALDHISELFVLLDADWRVVRLNRAARERAGELGLSPDDLHDRIIWDAIPALRGSQLIRAARQAVRDGTAVEVETFFAPLGRWFAARFLSRGVGLMCILRDITTERAAAAAAQSSTELAQAVLSGTGDAIYAKDLDGRYLMANRAFTDLVGRRLTGQRDRDAFPDPVAATIEENDRLVLERGMPLVFEESVVTASGQRLTLESSKSVLRDAAGRPSGVLSIARDITHAQRERRRRRLLYEAGAELTASLDVDTTLDLITRLVIPDFGDYCAVDLLQAGGSPVRARFAHTDRATEQRLSETARRQAPRLEWFDHPIAQALRTGEAVALYDCEPADYDRIAHGDEHRRLIADLRPTSLLSVPFLAREEVLGTLTVGYTTSGRRYGPEDLLLLRSLADRMALALANARLYRSAQEELRQRALAESQLSRLGRIFEHAGWGVALGDPATGRYVRVNPAYARMHGFLPEELVDESIWTLTAPSHRDVARAESARALETGRAVFQSRHVARDGREFPVQVDLAVVAGDTEGSVLYAANVQDITDREQSEERVRQAQKMEALGRLAGGVAHDFNNLLMVIMGFADFLSGSLEEDDPRRSDAVEIRKASERAAALTQQLMVFGRRGPVAVTAVSLNAAVDELAAMLRAVLGEKIALVLELAPDAGGVSVDRGQLDQALLNLALNAKDAMPEGGRLTLRTRRPATGGLALVEVEDTGHGMDDETQARIFEPFFSTRRSSHNTGLGLSVVYGIVTQHRGQVRVRSAPGRGSVFTLAFPRTRLTPPPAVIPEVPAGKVSGSVLVVEDDPDVRQLVSRALGEAGFDVVSAADADEAITMLRREGPVGVLVTDLVLPGMTGAELAARARHEQADLAVVFMSGYGDEDKERPDSRPVLAKPFAPGELVRRVRDAMGRM